MRAPHLPLLIRSRLFGSAPLCVAFWGLSLGFAPPVHAAATQEVHSPPSLDDLQQDVQNWMRQRQFEHTPVVDAVAPLWEFETPPSADQLFDALLRTFYLADDRARELVDACRKFEFSPSLLELKLPNSAQAAEEPLLAHNLRYFLARHLSQLQAYSDAIEIFDRIDLQYVVDPVGCLFHRAVCEHHLLMKQEGLATIDLLLNHTEHAPVRYLKLAELMQRDLEGLKEKSLGEVARQMKDVQTRLALGKADQGVQEVEDRIIETLDELIKKLEEQQQQQNSSPSAGSSNSPPEKPADDSYLGGVQGRGETDRKDIGHKDHWGNLPPKEQEAAKNLLDRQFPAHYRQAVEEYLKKLADRPAPGR